MTPTMGHDRRNDGRVRSSRGARPSLGRGQAHDLVVEARIEALGRLRDTAGAARIAADQPNAHLGDAA